MKKIYLCYITLALFFCITAIDFRSSNVSQSLVSNMNYLTQAKTVGPVDPDWTKLVTHLVDFIQDIYSEV